MEWRSLRIANNLFMVLSLLVALSGFWLGIFGAEQLKGSRHAKSSARELNHSKEYAMNGIKENKNDRRN